MPVSLLTAEHDAVYGANTATELSAMVEQIAIGGERAGDGSGGPLWLPHAHAGWAIGEALRQLNDRDTWAMLWKVARHRVEGILSMRWADLSRAERKQAARDARFYLGVRPSGPKKSSPQKRSDTVHDMSPSAERPNRRGSTAHNTALVLWLVLTIQDLIGRETFPFGRNALGRPTGVAFDVLKRAINWIYTESEIGRFGVTAGRPLPVPSEGALVEIVPSIRRLLAGVNKELKKMSAGRLCAFDVESDPSMTSLALSNGITIGTLAISVLQRRKLDEKYDRYTWADRLPEPTDPLNILRRGSADAS